MQATAPRLVSARSSAQKYDVLSAIALAGLEDASLPSQRALRLIAVITTRYNWSSNSLCIGHEELAALWKVSRRTVIREIEALRQSGLLVVLRPGRKGRVTTYRLCVQVVGALTETVLERDPTGVGARLASVGDASDEDSPTHAEEGASTVSDRETDEWRQVLSRLPSTVSISQRMQWLQPLRGVRDGARLEVIAGSPFRAAYVSRTFGDALRSSARSLGIEIIDFRSEASASR